MKKTICLIIVLFLLAAAREARSQEKIRVGQGSISLQSGLMHIGKDRGLFAKYGLTTESYLHPGRLNQRTGSRLGQSRSLAVKRGAGRRCES